MTEIAKMPAIRFKGFTEAWEQRKLDDIADVRDGTHDSPQYYSEGHPFVTSKNVKDGYINYDDIQYISYADFEMINKRSKVDKNDILMGMIGTIGNIALVREEPDFAIKNVALIKDIKKIYYVYLYHNLQSSSILDQLSEAMDGGTQKFIALNKIRNLAISVPKYEEQLKIGNFFERINNLITLHQRKLLKLKNVKKGMLEKMFPKNGSNVPEIRFAGFTDDWEQCKLGNIVERIVRKNTSNESTLPLTISAQHGLVDQITYFNNRVASRDVSNYYLVLNGEFAYNKSTSEGFPFGAVKRLDLYENGVLSTLYIVFGIRDCKETNSDFLTIFFDTDRWHKGVAERASEGARNHGLLNISADDFLDIGLFIPRETAEQKQIGTYFKKLDNLITLHQRKYEKLQNLKKACLEKMFV